MASSSNAYMELPLHSPRHDKHDRPNEDEIGDDHGPKGYHKLAETLMGTYDETAIFRKFGHLNMLNLLSLQAELVHLQIEWRRVSLHHDHPSLDSKQRFSTSFQALLQRQANGDDRPEQWITLLKIRSKLQEYSTFP